MGNSSGGYCAANVAVRRSAQFSTVLSLSGYFSGPITAFETVDPLRDARARLVNSPLAALPHLRRRMSFIAVSARDDRPAMQEIDRLVRVLRRLPADNEATITSPTGGHSSLPWRASLPTIIATLGNDLRQSGVTAVCTAPPAARHHGTPVGQVGSRLRARGLGPGARIRRR
jgi:enterochelin esterase-like enzyme